MLHNFFYDITDFKPPARVTAVLNFPAFHAGSPLRCRRRLAPSESRAGTRVPGIMMMAMRRKTRIAPRGPPESSQRRWRRRAGRVRGIPAAIAGAARRRRTSVMCRSAPLSFTGAPLDCSSAAPPLPAGCAVLPLEASHTRAASQGALPGFRVRHRGRSWRTQPRTRRECSSES